MMPAPSSSCPMCEAETIRSERTIKSPFLTGRRFQLFRCDACRSRFFDAPLGWEELAEHYDTHARSTSPDASFSRDPYNALIWKMIIQDGRVPEDADVLDVGCKFGDFLLNAPEGYKTTGIELSPHATSIARGRGLRVLESSIEEMTLTASYDIVTCLAVLEHLRSPPEALGRIGEIVKSGGKLVLLIPSPETLKALLWSRSPWGWHMHSPPQHLNFPSRKWLHDWLRKHGFRLSREFFTHGGMTDPIPARSLPGRIFNRLCRIWNESPMSRLPVFDHWYLIAEKLEGDQP